MQYAQQFYHSRYTNPAEADWKLDRQLKAYHYMERHMDSFETASLVIASTKHATIGKPLAIALYRFFGNATDEQVVNEPPPEIIVEAANEHVK